MRHTIDMLCAAAVVLLASHATGQHEPGAAEPVTVTVDAACVRNIGGVSQFRREQFTTIHAAPKENDLTSEDRDFLVNELEVSFGRDGGSRSWYRSQTRRS